MGNGDAASDGVQSDETLIALLETLQETGGAGVTALADRLPFAKSTIHRHLRVLAANEFVVRDGDEYRLGLRFLDLGGDVRTTIDHAPMVKETVEKLAAETGELVQFIVEEHGRGVFVYRRAGDDAVRTEARVGKRVPLHHTSAGKAVMAHLPEERVDDVVDRHGLPGRTGNTITDRESLDAELAAIRERGYAFDMDEHISGLWAMGAPVTRPDESVLGGLSIAGPTNRVKAAEVQSAFETSLLGRINELELNMSYS
jgi:DNA-binding IclR family transcriptional regulator